MNFLFAFLNKFFFAQQKTFSVLIIDRYAHLLPKNRNYNPKAIRVQSTDVDRTLMSAEAHLAGMFPITDEEKWGGIDWQPVPIHTIPKALDKV